MKTNYTLFLLAALMLGTLQTALGQAAGNRMDARAEYFHQPQHRAQAPAPSYPGSIKVTDPRNNSIVLEANVMINMQASSYVVIFSATQSGRTAKAADSLMGLRLNSFQEGMTKRGLTSESIHVDAISMVPVYEVEFVNKTFSNTANEVPTGFQIKKNVHVIFEDHTLLDGIISDAAKSEIYDIVKVDYNIDNIHLAYDTLRNVAIEIIEQNRELYDDLGLETKVMNLSEGKSCSYPAERYASYTAFHTGVSMEQAHKKNPNVEVKKAEKIKTIFYDKIPYNQFDMVLNADMVEPAVQFFYKLKVRYTVAPVVEEEAENGLSAK